MTSKIGIAAAGDPRDKRTWSGTPAALLGATESLGVEVIGFSGQVQKPFDNALYAATTTLKYGLAARRFRHYFGSVHRRDVKVFETFRANFPTLPIMHTDYMWLSPDLVSKHDFLYRDSGWSSWARARQLSGPLVKSIGVRYGRILSRIGHVFTTSEWARREIIADGAEPGSVSVVGTGVGTLMKPFGGYKEYSNGMTLCVAKVRHHDKGLDLLIDGFGLARQQRPDLTLHLVLPRRLAHPIAGVSTYVDLPAIDLIRLYELVPLYAMPARNEPYGLVFLEAQLARMAILGSDRGAFPEFADNGRTGFVLSDLTAEGVAQALLRAHSEPSQLERMGNEGQSQALTADWKTTMSKILNRML